MVTVLSSAVQSLRADAGKLTLSPLIYVIALARVELHGWRIDRSPAILHAQIGRAL